MTTFWFISTLIITVIGLHFAAKLSIARKRVRDLEEAIESQSRLIDKISLNRDTLMYEAVELNTQIYKLNESKESLEQLVEVLRKNQKPKPKPLKKLVKKLPKSSLNLSKAQVKQIARNIKKGK